MVSTDAFPRGRVQVPALSRPGPAQAFDADRAYLQTSLAQRQTRHRQVERSAAMNGHSGGRRYAGWPQPRPSQGNSY